MQDTAIRFSCYLFSSPRMFLRIKDEGFMDAWWSLYDVVLFTYSFLIQAQHVKFCHTSHLWTNKRNKNCIKRSFFTKRRSSAKGPFTVYLLTPIQQVIHALHLSFHKDNNLNTKMSIIFLVISKINGHIFHIKMLSMPVLSFLLFGYMKRTRDALS